MRMGATEKIYPPLPRLMANGEAEKIFDGGADLGLTTDGKRTRIGARRRENESMKKSERKEVTEELKKVRSEAGRKGNAVRWEGHEKTTTVRAYKVEAERLKKMGPTTAEALKRVFEMVDGKV